MCKPSLGELAGSLMIAHCVCCVPVLLKPSETAPNLGSKRVNRDIDKESGHSMAELGMPVSKRRRVKLYRRPAADERWGRQLYIYTAQSDTQCGED